MDMVLDLLRDKTREDKYTVENLIHMFAGGELRKDHPLQRASGQFSIETRDGLVASVIKHETIDSIKTCEQIKNGNVVVWLIDGIQRLTTLDYFRHGGFKLSKKIEFPIVQYQVVKKDEKGVPVKDQDNNIVYEIVQCDLRGKKYDDLPDKLKEKFNSCTLNFIKHLDCSDEEVGYHIRRYNRHSPMNVNQSAITYMDSVAQYVKNISENNSFFLNCGSYSDTDRVKNVIDRVVSESVMVISHLDDWEKNNKKMGIYLNQNSSGDEFDNLDELLCRLEKVVGDKYKNIFNTKSSFIWFGAFDRFTKFGLPDSEFPKFLDEFLSCLHGKKIDELSYDDVEANRKSGTKDKKVVKAKIELLDKLMRDYFGISGNTNERIDSLEFIKENVIEDILEDDVKFCKAILDDLTLNVDNNTSLLDERNMPSLLALVAYSCEIDVDLDEWIVGYFKQHDNYIFDQKKNYEVMKNDLDNFIKQKEKIAV